jgi:outer membrane murein-binding lipoprotein Lpp
MSRSFMFAGALALIVGGCASSAETEQRAQVHDSRARQAAAYQDYDHAAEEKHEANRLHAKAAAQRADEAGGNQVVAPPPPPAEVPPPLPPPEPLP